MKFTVLTKYLTVLFLLSAFIFTFGQVADAGAVEEVKGFGFYFKNVFLVGLIGQVSVLVADAYKHVGEGWNTSLFIQSKLKPFLFVQVGALLILLALIFVPQLSGLIDITSGLSLKTLTVYTLYATATALVDGILKKKK